MFREDPQTNKLLSMNGTAGEDSIHGDTPTSMWTEYMKAALKGDNDPGFPDAERDAEPDAQRDRDPSLAVGRRVLQVQLAVLGQRRYGRRRDLHGDADGHGDGHHQRQRQRRHLRRTRRLMILGARRSEGPEVTQNFVLHFRGYSLPWKLMHTR
ncbi:hypothetical protein SAMN06272735_4229 [Streptomyces sp. TLI_55]|nr:hypothetical protein SAMN06272735_4229 [Streptomyces sp. TLI_55]